jgi:VanZ family protein
MTVKKKKSFLPALLWAMVIFAISSIPYLSTPSIGFTVTDKAAHFAEYFILGALLAYGLAAQELRRGSVFLISAILSGSCGIIDELHQVFIPGRYVEGLDLLANISGSVAASGIYALIFRKRSS